MDFLERGRHITIYIVYENVSHLLKFYFILCLFRELSVGGGGACMEANNTRIKTEKAYLFIRKNACFFIKGVYIGKEVIYKKGQNYSCIIRRRTEDDRKGKERNTQ